MFRESSVICDAAPKFDVPDGFPAKEFGFMMLGSLIRTGEDNMRDGKWFRGNLFLLSLAVMLLGTSCGKNRATTMPGEESGIDRFLGTYTKNYGSYSYALILSVEEGALRYEVGNSYHGGWMANQYTEYSINGNELKGTKDDGVHTFLLNEDGSITATFSDMDFNNGAYERNDEYDETDEYPEGYP
ncbi:hypothetical protein D3Z51_19560 [Clostridiaceae bacterium]|nr:hypothetical protein [Clostridiaceae bacterium]RKI07946.1 hypothetical protein D7V81_19600 [bacterium 1XD21-70]